MNTQETDDTSSLIFEVQSLVKLASDIIPPVWPLQTFIACNPLHGMEKLKFEKALEVAEKFFVLPFPRDEKVNKELIKWSLAFLDSGQATISMPGREKGFYKAWTLLAPYDKKLNSESAKSKTLFASLPPTPEQAILYCLEKLKIPSVDHEEFLRRSMAELPGWAGYIKYRCEWENKNNQINNPITLVDFLAVRLVLMCLLSNTDSVKPSLKKTNLINIEDLKLREDKYLKNLIADLTPILTKTNLISSDKKPADAQWVFCIDVRSEPFRRSIESQGNYETFGFAGFFGVPVCVHPFTDKKTKDSCPVLLKPRHDVYEDPLKEPDGSNLKSLKQYDKGVYFFDSLKGFYQDLKYNFATPFALIETLGFWSGLWMGFKTFAPTASLKIKNGFIQKIRPSIATKPIIHPDEKGTGIPLEDQIHYAESALKMIGLTKNFSPLVILCGHGSATENNPYGSALDCGACGGNHGAPNAKILAAILNQKTVRDALKQKGITLPENTLFIAGQHNTTTDEVVLYDQEVTDNIHKKSLEKIKIDLKKAAAQNRQSRLLNFGLKKPLPNAEKQILKRSADWSEVRPEWGLARNAAFIIGPRSLTQGIDLKGRSFLHSYDYTQDNSGHSLETILTAPMVVAEWINTQYFFSTIDNVSFGSGSKVTHNIAGKLGPMQGNGSDLMHGLPLQSVNLTDDQRYHESLRLQVIVYAPLERIETIVKKQPILKTLFFNNWVILVAIDPLSKKSYRLTEGLDESPCFQALEPTLKTTPPLVKNKQTLYEGKSCHLASMHDKEKAISPAFSKLLKLQINVPKIDTDLLGTFTGEIERKGTPLDCARQKCEIVLDKWGGDIAIASEGSIGHHPHIPFIPSDHEILYFIDKKNDFHLHHSILTPKTNYNMQVISDIETLRQFADKALFPSHALIIRPHQNQSDPMIFKGIQSLEKLKEAFLMCSKASKDGSVFVETDMRAHMNPTRMQVIREIAEQFALRLQSTCPSCENPGWGVVGNQKGLECRLCGSETEMIRSRIMGCPKCDHKETKEREDKLTHAEPQHCPFCNP